MTDTEIDQFCKMMYEKVMIDHITHANRRGLLTDFIEDEMNDDQYVYCIDFLLEDDGIIVTVRTEQEEESPGLDVDNDDLSNQIKDKMKELNVNGLYTDNGIREWYESYMIPKLRNALDVVSL